MHIDPNQLIAGHSALQIRDLLRNHCTRLNLKTVQDQFQIDKRAAEAVIAELLQQNLLEVHPYVNAATRGEVWRTTVHGNAFANANARPPFKRDTAAKALQAFLERVEHVNAPDSPYAYSVPRVDLFGSYLSDSPTVNDIDLCIWTKERFSEDDKAQRQLEEQRLDLALDGGRNISGVAQILWPHTEVMLFLRQRSPILSFHDPHEPILKTGILQQTIYPAVVPA